MDYKIAIENEYKELIEKKWGFLFDSWPVLLPTKYHRTEIRDVKFIEHIRNFLLNRLGVIPVYFFLSVLFSTQHYVGPYRNVEKGLLILYHILSGCSIAEMASFIPRSSFFALYKDFFIKNLDDLNSKLDIALSEMFSNERIRIMSAMEFNPKQFKHVTLYIDGHDSRTSYLKSTSPTSEFYSYKLKKSGFRTQVCMDTNGMVIFCSESAACSSNNDGSMLADMNMSNIFGKFDCAAVDGAYTPYLDRFISTHQYLTRSNFLFPVRKTRNVPLDNNSATFNNVFGSFRSKIESFFGELGSTFTRFDNKKSIRVSDIRIFTIQFKLACVLLNIKRLVSMGNITSEVHHSFWMQNCFDYPNNTDVDRGFVFNDISEENSSLASQIDRSKELITLQKSFLELNLATSTSSIIEISDKSDGDILMPDDSSYHSKNEYEIEAILSHRRKKGTLEFEVKWKNYSDEENSYLTTDKFNSFELLNEYRKKHRL
jgi:hypothetical protein